MEKMIEQTSVRQNPGENYRKVFFNSMAELVIWYENSDTKSITGLQFSYGDFSHDHVIRWFIGKPVSFNVSEEEKFLKSTLLGNSCAFIYDNFIKKYPDILEEIPQVAKGVFEQMLRLLHDNKYVRHAITVD